LRVPSALPFQGTVVARPAMLIWPTVAVLVLGVVGVVLGRSLRRPGVRNPVVAFELAGTVERAREILDWWGDRGRRRMTTALWLDFLFLTAYAIGLYLACAWAKAQWEPRWPLLAWAGVVVAWGQIVAGAADALENVALLRMTIANRATARAAGWARRLALLKFTLVVIGLVYTGAGVIRFLILR